MNEKVEMLPCVNPASGEQFAEVPTSTPGEIAQARREMGAAFEIWRTKPVEERIRILRKLHKMIIDSVDIITETINLDTGKSRHEAMLEIFMSVEKLHQYYKHAPRWLERRRVPPGFFFFKRYYTEPQPYGVVAVIGPWNMPYDLSVTPMCSALLAGNTVLLKPSEEAGATGDLIARLIQSVPELSPFVRVLSGDGRVGAAIVQSKPDLVFLTGSTETGQKIARATAETMTPFLSELGGKDPMIVLEDADIAAAARLGAWGSVFNTGQYCVAVERVYVVESVYDEFLRETLKAVDGMVIGYSDDTENPCDLGPLTFERQKHIIQDHLDDAIDKGATIIHGGNCEGLFFEPTIVVDVDHSMKLMRDETFGPIMPIMKVKDEQEAIRLANDSYLGLSAYVWSGDLKRAQLVAKQLQVGVVTINDVLTHYAVSLLPFGGVKMSGSARIHSKDEVLQFTQLHSYAVGQPPPAIDPSMILRQPNRYRLASAALRLLYGATPGQRIQPIIEEVERLRQKRKAPSPAAIAAAGATAAIVAGAFTLLRSRK